MERDFSCLDQTERMMTGLIRLGLSNDQIKEKFGIAKRRQQISVHGIVEKLARKGGGTENGNCARA